MQEDITVYRLAQTCYGHQICSRYMHEMGCVWRCDSSTIPPVFCCYSLAFGWLPLPLFLPMPLALAMFDRPGAQSRLLGSGTIMDDTDQQRWIVDLEGTNCNKCLHATGINARVMSRTTTHQSHTLPVKDHSYNDPRARTEQREVSRLPYL